MTSSDEGDWYVAETGLPGRAECVNPAREVAVVLREAVGSGAGAGTALITASPGTPAEPSP